MDSATVGALVDDSTQGRMLAESTQLASTHLNADDRKAALKYISSHDDYSSYHVLFALRQHSPEEYQGIPDSAKAAILCSALVHLRFLNDFGYLDPGGSYDGVAAHALTETGRAALECLAPVLDDDRPAMLAGSEMATLSTIYHYRRRDFAYRYSSIILGSQPSFDPDPAQRDEAIAQFKSRHPPST